MRAASRVSPGGLTGRYWRRLRGEQRSPPPAGSDRMRRGWAGFHDPIKGDRHVVCLDAVVHEQVVDDDTMAEPWLSGVGIVLGRSVPWTAW